MTVWQWLSVTLSTKAGSVFGTTKDLGSTKIPLQAIAAAVLFPQNKDMPEVLHSIQCVVHAKFAVNHLMKSPPLHSDSVTVSLIEK